MTPGGGPEVAVVVKPNNPVRLWAVAPLSAPDDGPAAPPAPCRGLLLADLLPFADPDLERALVILAISSTLF